jgi:hypothetical protein
MNELENASIAGLIEAIKSRGHNLYMGIVDNEGAESLLLVDNFEKFTDIHKSLSLRARINGHRNPSVYSVIMPSEMYEIYNTQLLEGKYKEVAESIKELSTFKVLL